MMSFLKEHKEIFLVAFAFSVFVSNVVANVAMGLGLVYFLYCCFKEKPQLKEEYKPYLYVVGIFFAVLLLAALASAEPLRGAKLWLERWPSRFLLFLLAVLSLDRAEQAQKVLYGAFLGLGVNSVYMLIQFFALHNQRPNGFYGNAMMIGGLLCETLPILFILLLAKQTDKYKNYLMGTAALGVLGLIANGTRGAWLACLISVVLVLALFFLQRHKKEVCIGLVCLLCVGGFVLTNERLSERLFSVTNTTTNLSNTARLNMWRGAVAIFNDNPVLGVGEGQYRKNVVAFYKVPGQETAYDHAHSIIFHMLAVNGLAGFLSLLLMFGSILWWNLKRFLQSKNIWALAIFASTLTLLLQGLTEYNIGQASVMKLYWLLLGCLLVLSYLESRGGKDE